MLAAAQEHGLAPLVGSSPTVGAVGYTLGGGLGWLARRYGPACDAVRSFEVVTPDGELVWACRDEHPELFRALRGGGGGSLGVVTEMEIELFPVTDRLRRRPLLPGRGRRRGRSTAGRAWVADAPDELTSSVVLMNVPPSRVPEALRGRRSRSCAAAGAGRSTTGGPCSTGGGRRCRRSSTAGREMPFADLAAISRTRSSRCRSSSRAAGCDDASIAEVGAMLAAATFPATAPPPLRYCEIRHAGGAVATGDREHSSMGNRDRPFLLHLVGVADAAADDAGDRGATSGRRRRPSATHLSRPHVPQRPRRRRAPPCAATGHRRRRPRRHRRDVRAASTPTTSCASASTTTPDR